MKSRLNKFKLILDTKKFIFHEERDALEYIDNDEVNINSDNDSSDSESEHLYKTVISDQPWNEFKPKNEEDDIHVWKLFRNVYFFAQTVQNDNPKYK